MAAAKKGGTAVAKKEDAAVVVVWDDDDATGFENDTADDYALPFIKILQKGSPEVDPDDGAFIDGAKIGQFCNTATGELSDTIDVVPCYYSHKMVEWRPREDGGGFVAQHDPGAEKGLDRDESGRFLTKDNTYLSDTRYYFCEQVTAEGLSKVVLSFSSTQIKKSKSWRTRQNDLRYTAKNGTRRQAPMWSHIWRLATMPESNDKGSWRGYKIDLVGPITDADMARAVSDSHRTFSEISDRVKPPANDAPSGGGSVDGDDIPF